MDTRYLESCLLKAARSEALRTAPTNSSSIVLSPTTPYSKYYKVLGVDLQAQLPEIRAAFLKLAKENNPNIESNKDRFMEISNAYQMLKKHLQSNLYGACNLYSRLDRVFDKIFAITETTNNLNTEPAKNPTYKG